MDHMANSGVFANMFGVPCVVADNFLKLANGDQLKVLLYLMRASGRAVSTEEISANTGVSPDQTEEAVMFWQQVNVLSTEDPSMQNNIMLPKTEPQPKAPEAPSPSPQTAAGLQKKSLLRPSDIADMLNSNPDISELFKVAEITLGTLNNSMQNSLIWMFNYLGLKKEVILILIGYCAEINKASASYIEKIATSWAEKDINTLEAATAEVERLNYAHSFAGEIKRIFEMQHNPTSNQLRFIGQWQAAGFGIPLIRCAYEETVEKINKVSFDYINKILLSWQENGFKTPEDVKASKDEYRKNKRSDNSASSDGFDADKYKMLINNI